MDNFSSADLDSSSKTPLYLGIAAVILGLTGLCLGWIALSKANSFESRIGEVSTSAETIANNEEVSSKNTNRIAQIADGLIAIRDELNQALKKVQSDISSTKKNIRSVAIQAGTALKKVEEMEANGVQVVSPTKSTTSSQSGDSKGASSGEEGLYKIQKGDTLAALAARFKVTLTQLFNANPGVDPTRLRIGQEIVIPGL